MTLAEASGVSCRQGPFKPMSRMASNGMSLRPSDIRRQYVFSRSTGNVERNRNSDGDSAKLASLGSHLCATGFALASRGSMGRAESYFPWLLKLTRSDCTFGPSPKQIQVHLRDPRGSRVHVNAYTIPVYDHSARIPLVLPVYIGSPNPIYHGRGDLRTGGRV